MAKAVNTSAGSPEGGADPGASPAEFVKSPVGKALQVLTALCAPGGPHRLGALASHTGLAKPTVHRLLRTLCAGGYAQPAPGGSYRPGPLLLRLAAVTLDGSDLVGAARPVLVELARRSGLAAQLYVPDGEFAVLVAQERGASGVGVFARVGGRSALGGSAVGVAVLAGGGAGAAGGWSGGGPAVDERADLAAAAGERVPGARGAGDEARAVRERLVARAVACGYAVDDGLADPDTRMLAAAVPDGDGAVAGVIALAGPAFTLPPDAAETYGPLVRSAARQVGAVLAARGGGLGVVAR